MDPLTSALTFSQIVGLLADFASSRPSNEVLSIGELARWLASHGHDEVIGAIERNHATSIAIKAALSEGKDELLAKIAALDAKLGAVAAGLGPFESLARAILPGSELSDQAKSLLCEIERGQVALMMEHQGRTWELLGVKSPERWQWEAIDERFVLDDLDRLLHLRLVSAAGRNSAGKRLFSPTRLGSEVARQLLARKTG